jgi:hypothetical protein
MKSFVQFIYVVSIAVLISAAPQFNALELGGDYSVNQYDPYEDDLSERAGVTCMAFWSGYENKSGKCEYVSYSGCSKRPSTFTSKSACESAAGKIDLKEENDY